MKSKLLIALAACAILAGCVEMPSLPNLPVKDQSPYPATTKDVAGKRFVLHILDGNTVEERSGSGFDLEFSSGMQLAASGCNRFSGKAKLEEGRLSVPVAASTQMFCADHRALEMDKILTDVFANGATAIMERGKLRLQSGEHTLLYVPANFKTY